MEIHVTNREGIDNLIKSLSDSVCVISITDPDSNSVVLDLHEADILRLEFHDLDRTHSSLSEVTYFSKSLARQIVNFVLCNSSSHTKQLIVHCEAGVSRSPAVAMAISSYFNTTKIWELCRTCAPNMMVFAILRMEFRF